MTNATMKVTFKKRTEQQIADKVALNDPAVPTVTTTYDFSELTDEQILQWAMRGVTIHVQAGLKSGSITENDLADKTFKVPEPGDRKRLSDTDKLRRLVGQLLGKDEKDVTTDDILTITARLTG